MIGVEGERDEHADPSGPAERQQERDRELGQHRTRDGQPGDRAVGREGRQPEGPQRLVRVEDAARGDGVEEAGVELGEGGERSRTPSRIQRPVTENQAHGSRRNRETSDGRGHEPDAAASGCSGTAPRATPRAAPARPWRRAVRRSGPGDEQRPRAAPAPSETTIERGGPGEVARARGRRVAGQVRDDGDAERPGEPPPRVRHRVGCSATNRSRTYSAQPRALSTAFSQRA